MAVAVALMLPGAASAQLSMPGESFDSQVVLELYTSQGCSACPPADAMMAELAMREDVIALALHVDYWDYIGWADGFADPEHAERQKRYARRHGHSTIYTPQVVINGMEIMEGFRVLQVMETIAEQRIRQARVELSIERIDGDILSINADAVADTETPLMLSSRSAMASPAMLESLDDGRRATTETMDLQLVRYIPAAMVEIEAGENSGRLAHYHNIVTSWEMIGTWDQRTPLRLQVSIEGSDPAVVIMQERGQGEIVVAARLR